MDLIFLALIILCFSFQDENREQKIVWELLQETGDV